MRVSLLSTFPVLLLLMLPLFGAESALPSLSYEPLTGKERLHLYMQDTFESPGTFLSAFASAAPIHSRPPIWGSKFEGFAARAGDNYLHSVISNSIEAWGANALGEEIRYVPCSCHGFFRRVGHALAMGVLTLNTQGNYVPAFARIGGAFGSQFIGDAWRPDDYRTRKRALASVGFSLAMGSVMNIVHEFRIGRRH